MSKPFKVKTMQMPLTDTLYPWQKLILDEVERYEEFVESLSIQTLNDFEQNRASLIQANLRKGAGHTFLTSYLAKACASAVLYFDVDHYKEMEILGDTRGKEAESSFHEDTVFVSIFELRHDIMLSNKADWVNENLNRLRDKFKNKKIIVIDRATEVREKFPELVDFICNIAQNSAFVLLG